MGEQRRTKNLFLDFFSPTGLWHVANLILTFRIIKMVMGKMVQKNKAVLG